MSLPRRVPGNGTAWRHLGSSMQLSLTRKYRRVSVFANGDLRDDRTFTVI